MLKALLRRQLRQNVLPETLPHKERIVPEGFHIHKAVALMAAQLYESGERRAEAEGQHQVIPSEFRPVRDLEALLRPAETIELQHDHTRRDAIERPPNPIIDAV